MEIYLGLFLLLVNTGLTLFYVLKADKGRKIFGVLFFFVPCLGFAMFYLPKGWYYLTQKHNIYDKTNVVLELEGEELIRKPEMQEEMNVISIDAAMAGCTPQERRTLLLNVLKNDLVKNVKIIRTALYDADSETSHYAAAATMETYKKLKSNIQELEAGLSRTPDNLELRRELLDVYYECIDSGVLVGRDYDFFLAKYTKHLEDCRASYESILLCEDYIQQAECYRKLLRNYEAIETIDVAMAKYQNEASYFKGLEIHYTMKNKKKFDALFDKLKKSNIPVSNQTVELIRFWNTRCS